MCDKMPYKRDVIQYFFYFATFLMKKKNFKFKTVKVEGFYPRSRLRSAATPQYPSKLKKLISLFLVLLLLYHAFSYYDTQNSIVIASVRTQSRKIIL
jgi:hypothetical protein